MPSTPGPAHTQKGSTSPERFEVWADASVGSTVEMICHLGAWGGRKREVRGLEGTDQATELAAKGDNPAQVPMGPASSSQASPGAIPRPARPLTDGQLPRQPGDEGSLEMRAAKAESAPPEGAQSTESPHARSTHPFVIDGAVLGQVLVGTASPAQENHQRQSSPSLLSTFVGAVL